MYFSKQHLETEHNYMHILKQLSSYAWAAWSNSKLRDVVYRSMQYFKVLFVGFILMYAESDFTMKKLQTGQLRIKPRKHNSWKMLL